MGYIPATGDSEGIKLLVIVVVFFALALFMVALRLWARRIKKQSLVLNDYACIVALLFTAGLGAAQLAAIFLGGVGQHLTELTPSMAIVILQAYTFAWPLWAVANTAVRISVLHFLTEIFRPRPFRIAAWCLMAISGIYMLGVFVNFVTICTPFRMNWSHVEGGHCGSEFYPYLLSGIFGLVIDLAIIILPMPMLWGLQLPRSKKIALSGVFGTGVIICITTVFRIVAVVQFNTEKYDFSYYIVNDGLWASLEPSVGVINACLPLLPPILQRMSESSAFNWTRGATAKQSMSNLPTAGASRAASETTSKKSPSRWATVGSKDSKGWSTLDNEVDADATHDTYPLTMVKGSTSPRPADLQGVHVVKTWEVYESV